ncbi:MAG: hypothetical protein D6732_23320 [Methanobacteriota archaeon]|nr:MAG: hypothetical protein D6732_23320 [Euryarchaeota archaeon]
MVPDSVIATKLVAVDYYGGCNGVCEGCAMTIDERRRMVPYLDGKTLHDRVVSAVERLSPCERIAIEIGRGNILNMDDVYWDDFTHAVFDIFKTCDRIKGLKKLNIEITASLIGDRDEAFSRGECLIERIYNINNDTEYMADVRFSIVGNSAIGNRKYWEHILDFLERMELRREEIFGTKTNCGDLLIMNLDPSNPPRMDIIDLIYEREWKSTVNFALWASRHAGNTIISTASEDDFRQTEAFVLKAFEAGIDIGGWESIGKNNIDDNAEILPSIMIDKNGNYKTSYFTPVGFFDPGRFMVNEIPNLMSVPKTCLSCCHFGICRASGALLPIISLSVTFPYKKQCPNCMKSLLNAQRGII